MSETATQLNLHQKLAKITGEVGAIAKGGTNNEQKYKFIEYAAVAGELRGLFAKYNVLIVPYMQKTKHQTRTAVESKYGAKGQHVLVDMTFVVTNADDPSDKFSVSWTGEALDYGDKATNKAATSALKYYLMRQFNISEQGDDPDAESPDLGKSEPADKPSAPKAAAPKKANPSQIKLMMTAAKRASGLEERNDVISFFQDEIGKSPTQVPADQVGDIIKKFTKAVSTEPNDE